MRHTLLAAVSALALTLAAGSAMASGYGHHDSTGLLSHSDQNAVSQASKGGVAAASGSTALSDGSAQLNNSNPSYTSNHSFSKIEVVSTNSLSAHFGGSAITLAPGGNWAASSISQDGNAFQDFAGINTMTQSTAAYNNNQAATSIAAYAPVNFGSGSASQ